MVWAQEQIELRNAGFTDPEIVNEAARQREDMESAGFASEEIDKHFGTVEPDMTPVKNIIKANLEAMPKEEGEQKEAKSFLDYLDAGFQMSSGDMMRKAFKGESVRPDMLVPSDAPTFYRVASQAATLAGDLPAMLAGEVIGAPIGAAAGSPAGPPGIAAGAFVGGSFGAGALPAAIRTSLMEYYEKGEIQNFSDFWERTSAVFIDTMKDGTISTATLGVGKGVAGKMLAKGVGPAAARIASTSSEIATMVTLGKGFEGHAPALSDFTDAALLVGGLHFATKTPKKLREIYARTGMHPAEVVQEAKTNPVVMQELLSDGDSIPKMYEEMAIPMAEKKPAEAAAIEPTEPTAQDKILSRIGDKPEKQSTGYTKDDFYRDFVDRLDPVKRAMKDLGADADTLTAKDNPYKLARMANDYKAKTQYFFEKGTLDFKTLEKTGKSFNEIIEPVKKDMAGLKAFMVSKRALELEGRGIKHGFDLDAAKEMVKTGAEKFEGPAKELVQFQNSALKYLKDSGRYSAKQVKAMERANQSYVSFKRVIDAGEGGGKGSAKKPIKNIKGSERMIQDPFISMIDNIELYTQAAEKNRATKALVDLAAKTPDQTLIVKEKTPLKEIQIKADEVVSALEEQGFMTKESFAKNIKSKLPGITDAQIEKAFKKELDAGNGLDAEMIEGFSIFRPNPKDLAPNQFEVFRDGKREVYTTEPELAEAIRTLDGNGTAQNVVFKLAQGITSVKRLGISLMPDFVVKNFIRDQVTAGTLSKTGPVPLVDTIRAMGDLIKKNDHYYNWLKAGGANGAFLELSDKYMNENIYKLDKQVGFIDKTWNLVQKPIHYLELAGTLAEQATRLAEAKRVMGQASKGAPIFEAGFASRESTIDFQRMGAKISATNMITAFQNAGIQGLDRSARAVKADPKGLAIRAGSYITAPSILLWWANKDDERVKELPQWQKDLNWIVATDSWQAESVAGEADDLPPYLVREKNGVREINKGIIYRLPKPQELGLIFGTLPERVLEAFFTDNPDAFGEFGETMTNLITPAFMPDAMAPMFEQYANKSFFTDHKLVPSHLEKVLPQYQYTDYTSETAKAMGKLVMHVPGLNDIGGKSTKLASPIVIENYVRSWSGSLGMYAIQLADQGLKVAGVGDVKVKPAASISDIPFIKAFVVRNPSANSKSIGEFDKIFEENEQIMTTIKSLMKRGNYDEAEKLMMNEENQAKMANLSGTRDAINAQAEFIQKVFRNPELTADEKRQLIDGVYYGIMETARVGLEVGRELRKDLNKQIEGEN